MELQYEKFENGKVICQECGKAVKLLSPSHLKKHKMNMKAYKKKYPGCPISSKEYKAARFDFKDSALFKDDADKEQEPKKSLKDIDKEQSEKIEAVKNPKTIYKAHANKVAVLEYLNETYPNLVNNYRAEKYHFDTMLYSIMTDMADPIKKVVFEFPNVFWHNSDPVSPFVNYRLLKEDGWTVIVIESKKINLEDLDQYKDMITD